MIREIRQNEVPDLIQIGLRLHQQSAYGEYPLAVPEVFKGVMQMVQSANATVLVSVKKNRIRGYLGLIVQPYWWASPVSGPRFAFDRHFFASNKEILKDLVEAGTDWAFAKPRVVDITLGVASGIKTEEMCEALELAGMERLGGFYWISRSFEESKAQRKSA